MLGRNTSRRYVLGSLCLVIALIVACEGEPAAPDSVATSTEASFARGGIPGPPSDVTIPPRTGPPPELRMRIPPQAGPPAFLENVVDVGAGNGFSCALRADGAAFCWGDNASGQLGDGTTLPSGAPIRVNTATPFTSVFVGDLTACGLEADGTAHCWGDNSRGQLGAGSADAFSAVPIRVAAPHRFTELSMGVRGACGMAVDDGLAYCWGSNSNGWLGVGSPALFTAAPMPVVNGGTIGLASVNTSGLSVTCGLTALGAAFCWGLDIGLFGNGSTANAGSLVPVAAANGGLFETIHVSHGYVCALDVAGQAFCWGSRNDFGEMGIGSVAEPILVPTPVVGGHAFASLDTDDTNLSFKSTCGVTTAGDGWCWGYNEFGQLGAPSGETCLAGLPCSTSPLPVGGGVEFSEIRVGAAHACGLSIDGAVYCWGRNHAGQLGDGTMTHRAEPVAVRVE